MPNPVTDFLTNRYLTTGSAAGLTQPRADWGNIAKDLGAAAAIYGIVNPNDSSGLASFFGTGGQQQPVGYTGGIPNYTATRELAPNAFAQTYTTPTGEVAPRVPGSAGRRYFTDTQFTQDTATPFMGITAEQIAAQNLAAQNELALFENILGGVETQRETAATTPTGGITTPTGGITGIPATITPTGGVTTPTGGITGIPATITPTGGVTTPTTGTTTTGTTTTGTTTTGTTPTAYDTFADSLKGRELTAADAAAIAASGYSLNDLASTLSTATMPIDALELRNFVNYYTDGSTTTDDGLVGTTGMGNLLVSLGGTRNADGTITDVTGTTYSIQDGAWRPVAATTGTTTTGTTDDGKIGTTEMGNLLVSLGGTRNADGTITDVTGTTYSIQDGAWRPVAATTGTTTTGTTDDGKIGTTEMGNLLVSLGGTRNADGTITDVTGTTYSIQDGAWRPVAATTGTTTTGTTTTGTTTTGTTTTGTAPTAYDNFIASYAAKDVADFTAADYTALASSGYALSDIATSLNVTESSLANALDLYSPENVAFQNFMGSLPTTLSSAEHAQALLNSGYSLEKIASGYTNTTASQLQAFIDGFDTADTATTDTTGTTTTGTTGTTTTDTTGADAVDTLLNSTEQWMVANRGYTDNGDGTITDSTNGYVYDNDTGEGYFPTTVTDDTTGAGETLTLNAADGSTSTIDLTGGTTSLTTTGTADPAAGPLAPTFDMVDASDGLSKQDQDIIYSVMTTSGANIADVAEEFGTTQDEVITGLLRGGYQTPAEIAATLNAVDPDTEFTEEDLIANLLETNKTTPEEVAAYYGIPVAAVTARYRELGGSKFAQGGNVNGYYLGGPTDGMADQIPATIDNMQPAALSDGEFVIPADVVSHLGNGNSDAGAKNLYSMMERVRTDRTGNPKQGKQIDPNKYLA